MPSIPESLRHWAAEIPDSVALCLLDGHGDVESTLTYRELDRAAQSQAAAFASAGCAGRPVLLPAEQTAAFVASLCGAMLAGAVPAPVPASLRPAALDRLGRIVADGGIGHAVATGPASVALQPLLPRLRWCAGSGARASWDGPPPGLERPALLQYTSGSTGAPKGVVLSHANIAANLDMVRAAFAAGPESRILSWLPLHHDMGLVGQLLLALHCGASLFLMSPLAFVRRPQVWLHAIAAHKATISGGPNFAYELCLRRQLPVLPPDALAAWQVAFCGAERVRPATLARFAERLAPFGFDPRALFPCYGLAEASVYVSGGPAGQGLRCAAPAGQDAQVASCGQAAASVAIVDPALCRPVPDGAEGEIWVAGPHVAQGYWNHGADTTFANALPGSLEAWLRTGDTGFRRDGALFVTGRLKELIVQRGENIHPEDVEAVIAASDPRLGAVGCVFALDDGEEERIVALWQAPPGLDEAAAAGLFRAARLAVADAHAIRLHDLVLVAGGRIPRTTSGKIQRAFCRQLYRAGTFDSGRAGKQRVTTAVEG